jgi:hypothetical protein
MCFIQIIRPTLTPWLWLWIVPFTWQVYIGCLLPKDTWSYLWYTQGSFKPNALIYIFFRIYEIDNCLLYYPFNEYIYSVKGKDTESEVEMCSQMYYLLFYVPLENEYKDIEL